VRTEHAVARLPSSAASAATNASKTGWAISGRAAADQDGRWPFFVDAYSVNCDTAKIPPPCSAPSGSSPLPVVEDAQMDELVRDQSRSSRNRRR